jgi:hypothetical protein
MIEEYGFDSPKGQYIFLFSIKSRPVLGHSQPPTNWVPGAVFPGVQRHDGEADHSPPPSAEVENGGDLPPLAPAPSWRGA